MNRFRSALTAFLMLTASGAYAQTVLFGVTLNAQASALVSEVEQLYGKPIRQEWLTANYPMSGKSKIADDGTPIVLINPSHGQNADVLVHELYHLKLQNRGFPILNLLVPIQIDTEADRVFAQLPFQFYDPVLHYVFYPEVRTSMDINPGETYERLTRKSLDDARSVSTIANMDGKELALHYFKLQLESADALLIQQFVGLLEKQERRDALQLGERLAQIVRRINPASPHDAINALVECLNVFHEGQYHFIQRPWTTRQLGEYRQQMAQIEVEPIH